MRNAKLILTAGGTAEVLGITPTHLARLAKQGVLEKVSHGRYDLADTVKRFTAYRESIIEEKYKNQDEDAYVQRVRLVSEQADRQALENVQLRAKYVAMPTAAEALEELRQKTVQRIAGIGERVAGAIAGTKDVIAIKSILDTAVRYSLNTLADESARYKQ